MNGRLRVTLKDNITKTKFLNKMNCTPSCQSFKSKNRVWNGNLLYQSRNHLPMFVPSQYPLPLNPQRLPHLNLLSQNPHQEASTKVSLHEPSCWDSDGPAENPASDDAQRQQPCSTARPPHQLATYSGDSR